MQNGGTAYYNLDLQMESVLESLPSNFWMSPMTEIPSFDFSISSPWVSSNGLKDSGFWSQLVQQYNRSQVAPLFTWDGALVRLYLSNGQIPGLINSGTSTWSHPDAGWSITYTTPTAYTISDNSKLYFKGFLRSKQEDSFRTPFSVDGTDRRMDAPIGSKGSSSSISTAEIVPIPIGAAAPYVDGDNWNAFPIYHEAGATPGINMKTASVDIVGGSVKGVLFFDKATNQISATNQVTFSVDNKTASISNEISGAVLEKSRNATSDWDFTQDERAYLGFPNTPGPFNQQLLIQDGEIIGLHGQDEFGAGDPSIGAYLISFSDEPSFESRGWGETEKESHSAGDQYSGQGVELTGGRPQWVNYGPVSDFSDGEPVVGLSNELRKSRGSTGNIWDMIIRSEYRNGVSTASETPITLANQYYGPGLHPDGSATFFRAAPCENDWTFYIKPRRMDFGTDDVLEGIYINWDIEVTAIDGGFYNGSFTFFEYKDSSGVWQSLTGIYAVNATTEYESENFGNSLYFAPIGATTIDELFDEDWLRIRIQIASNYSTGIYYHPKAYLNGLRLGCLVRAPVAGKKMFWYGNGMSKAYGAATVVTDSSAAVKSLMISQAAYDETEIDETNNVTNLKICGAIKKQDTLRNIIRKISSDSQLLTLIRADGTTKLNTLTSDPAAGTITDSMVFFDGNNLPEITYSSTDIMEIYTSIEIRFRQNPESEDFLGSLVVDENGFQNWIGQRAKLISPNVWEYHDYDWAQLTYGELVTMINLCRKARQYASVTGQQEKVLTIDAQWIRDRATAESLFAKITAWATTVRTIVEFSGDFSTLADIKIGDQYKIGLSAAFSNPRTEGKTFIVSKKQTEPSGDGWGVSITLDEMPIVGGLTSGV